MTARGVGGAGGTLCSFVCLSLSLSPIFIMRCAACDWYCRLSIAVAGTSRTVVGVHTTVVDAWCERQVAVRYKPRFFLDFSGNLALLVGCEGPLGAFQRGGGERIVKVSQRYSLPCTQVVVDPSLLSLMLPFGLGNSSSTSSLCAGCSAMFWRGLRAWPPPSSAPPSLVVG